MLPPSLRCGAVSDSEQRGAIAAGNVTAGARERDAAVEGSDCKAVGRHGSTEGAAAEMARSPMLVQADRRGDLMDALLAKKPSAS